MKKHSSGKILPKTLQGTSTKLEDWLSIYQLENIANNRLEAYIDKSEIIELDRIDIRKNKGIVKYIFKNNNYEIQLDGVTGDVLQVGVRHSDWI